MLKQVVEGVRVHTSEFMQSNAVIVEGDAGVLVIDAGILRDELVGIAHDIREQGHVVAAGFSTHPHWDHLLWHPELGTPPRYGTAGCAAVIAARLTDPGFLSMAAGMIPPEIVERVPLDDIFGRITGLPENATRIPWAGPEIRIIEHQAHAAGHAALLVEERGVLVAGDMLSDVLIPILNFMAPDPIGDYLAALQLFEDVAGDVAIVIPGHGSVGGSHQVRARIAQDRAYVSALHDGQVFDDPRIGMSAKPGWEWVSELHAGQLERIAAKKE
ncbi:MAG: MBL fold metallo-hydrolase [Rhodoglobus sp.]